MSVQLPTTTASPLLPPHLLVFSFANHSQRTTQRTSSDDVYIWTARGGQTAQAQRDSVWCLSLLKLQAPFTFCRIWLSFVFLFFFFPKFSTEMCFGVLMHLKSYYSLRRSGATALHLCSVTKLKPHHCR